MTGDEGRGSARTAKGRATRERIVETAAELIYRHGVQSTSNDLVRQTAGVSGSQLSHYFADKESLVRAVIAWRADSMIGRHDDPPPRVPDSLAALRAWAGRHLRRKDLFDGGCSFGSLASEVMKSNLDVHDAIAAGFEQWKEQLRGCLRAMQERGELRPEADVDRLAHVLMAAFQGGMLLTQAARDTTPLRDALDGAIDYIACFATDGRR